MSISNYDGLKAAINDWLNRDDLANVSETFIQLAEAKFNRELRLVEMIVRVDAQLDQQYLGLPPDFLQAFNLQVNANPPYPLKYTQPDLMDEMRLENLNAVGKPTYYTLVGEQFEFEKTPDSTYDLEVAYYKKIPALSGSNPSNFLLAKHPDLYLYAALVEAAPYLKDDARIQVWGTLFQQAMDQIKFADIRKRSGGSTIKVKARTFG